MLDVPQGSRNASADLCQTAAASHRDGLGPMRLAAINTLMQHFLLLLVCLSKKPQILIISNHKYSSHKETRVKELQCFVKQQSY